MRKAARLLLVLVLIATGGAIAFAGTLPEGYKSVGAVVSAPGTYLGEEVQIKAAVLAGSLNRTAGPLTFVVHEPGAQLLVQWSPDVPLPEHEAGGTLEGKTVVVKGVLRVHDGRVFLEARDMQVGCASKYEPSPPTPA